MLKRSEFRSRAFLIAKAVEFLYLSIARRRTFHGFIVQYSAYGGHGGCQLGNQALDCSGIALMDALGFIG